jgi:hypothetical protein
VGPVAEPLIQTTVGTPAGLVILGRFCRSYSPGFGIFLGGTVTVFGPERPKRLSSGIPPLRPKVRQREGGAPRQLCPFSCILWAVWLKGWESKAVKVSGWWLFSNGRVPSTALTTEGNLTGPLPPMSLPKMETEICVEAQTYPGGYEGIIVTPGRRGCPGGEGGFFQVGPPR